MSSNAQPRAATGSGTYLGAYDDRRSGVAVFRGIRYAQPPIGSLRLQAPRPLPPPVRGTVIDATRFGASPPQVRPGYLADVEHFDEDCLTLNVWQPATASSETSPVIVWLYGGGFRSGGTSSALYDGATLAGHGAVVVSVNYRVGALGFGSFAHRDPSLAEATNLGLRDVIAALQWIQANIAGFGGDPTRVCVVGQSAGAFLAGALLGAPSADGLYASLVSMSGGPYKVIDAATARAMGDEILAAVGIPPDQAVTADRLRDVPVADWVASADAVTESDVGDRNAVRIRGLAVVDDSRVSGGVLAAHPMERHFPAGVGILLTATTHEAVYWQRQGPPQFRATADREALEDDLVRWGIGDPVRRRTILDRYISTSATPDDARQRLLTDWIFHLPEARAAVRANELGAAGWLALVSVPELPETGHFDDTAHFFGTATNPTPAQLEFGRHYRDLVVGFAATGEVDWPRFDTTHGTVRHLSDEVADREAGLVAVLAGWDGIARE